MQPLVKLKKHPPSGTIILNRPEKRNSLNRAMLAELQQAFEDFHLERQVRAVVLTGAGSAFCAGADLGEMQETSRMQNAQTQWYHDTVQYKELIELMLRFPKPIIAAVNGPALADGAGLVLASDIVVGTPEAAFGFPEPRRGLVAGLVSPLLVFRIGGGYAANLLLTAQLIDAAEAHRLHVYHELTKSETIWARAHELAALCAVGRGIAPTDETDAQRDNRRTSGGVAVGRGRGERHGSDHGSRRGRPGRLSRKTTTQVAVITGDLQTRWQGCPIRRSPRPSRVVGGT